MTENSTMENLLQVMELACGDTGVESCQGRIQYARGFSPCCLAKEDVACDVGEVLWPDKDMMLKPNE